MLIVHCRQVEGAEKRADTPLEDNKVSRSVSEITSAPRDAVGLQDQILVPGAESLYGLQPFFFRPDSPSKVLVSRKIIVEVCQVYGRKVIDMTGGLPNCLTLL